MHLVFSEDVAVGGLAVGEVADGEIGTMQLDSLAGRELHMVLGIQV